MIPSLDRAVGKIPISIATSMAFEGIFGIHDNLMLKQPYPITKCDEVWVNITTLARNIMGSYDKHAKAYLTTTHLNFLIQDEIRIIKSSLEMNSAGRVKLVVYVPTYKSLEQRYPRAVLKKPTTPTQRLEEHFIDEVVKTFTKNLNLINTTAYIVDLDIPGDRDKAIYLLTHIPVDLLHFKDSRSLALMESHTGVVKQKTSWYTKLKNGKDYYRIPFDRMTIQMFGDSSGMFVAQDMKLRKVILDIAEKDKWTQLHDRSRIIKSILSSSEPILAGLVNGLY